MIVPTNKQQTNSNYLIIFGAILLGLSLIAAFLTKSGIELATVIVNPLSFVACYYYFHKATKAKILKHPLFSWSISTTRACVGCLGLILGLSMIFAKDAPYLVNSLLSIGIAFLIFFPFLLLEALKNIPRQLSIWQYTLSLILPIIIVTLGLLFTIRPEVSGTTVANMALVSSASLVACGIYLRRAKPWRG